MALARFESRTVGGLLLRGVVAILFGLAVFARPGAGAAALVFLFGAYAFIDGICSLVAAFKVAEMGGRWWPMVIVGFCGVIVGILCFSNPAVTALGLVMYIGVWAVVTGALEIIAAIRLRKVIQGEWVLAVSGLLSVVFGLLLAARPGAGLLGVVWLIGAYAIAFGALMIGVAIRLRGVQRRMLGTPRVA